MASGPRLDGSVDDDPAVDCHSGVSCGSGYGSCCGDGPGGIVRARGDNLPFDQRVQAAFCVAVVMKGHRAGQRACLKERLHRRLIPHLWDNEALLRQWACLCYRRVCAVHAVCACALSWVCACTCVLRSLRART